MKGRSTPSNHVPDPTGLEATRLTDTEAGYPIQQTIRSGVVLLHPMGT